MEIEKIARKLEPLMPEKVKKWRRTRDMADSELKQLMDKQLLFLAHKELGDFRNKILLSLPPKRRAYGEIKFGTVLYEKEKWLAGISTSELLQNLAIFGRSGAGKTNLTFFILEQLLDKNIPFLFLDWKRTARHLIPMIKKPLRVYTPGRPLSPFPFNPFIPPHGLEYEVYINLVIDVMAEAYTLGDGAKSLLQKALIGYFKRNNRYPAIPDLQKEIEAIPAKGRVGGWKVTALRALESIQLSGLCGSNGASQEELAQTLLQNNTILELDALSEGGKRFLIPLLSLWLFYTQLESPEREQLQLVLFIEEAHHVFYSNTHTAKESVMNMLLRQCREVGLAMVVIDQHPSMISGVALGNTYASICMNLKDRPDINRAAAISLLEDDEKRYFSVLPVGQGIVKLQDRWRKPFLVQFPHVKINKGYVTDAVLMKYLREEKAGSGRNTSLEQEFRQVRQIRAEERSISEDELKMLGDVIDHADDGVKVRYKRLYWSAYKGHRTKEDLIEHGWLDHEKVSVGNSRKELLRLSRKARDRLGIAPGVKSNRGSLVHEYWKRFYARLYRADGWKVELEASRVGGRVDVLAMKSGERVGIEIETGKSDVVANVRNGLRSRFGQVIVVATDEKALRSLEEKLAKAGLVLPSRVRLVLREG